ncbi:MAG: shikimate kinase [Bacteroidales bacterium]|jgi:shikimate kinase|nr:shikimate kinase [Bacteroidales bacterium]
MKIYLIGFMGCGKSTVGKKLASHYGCTFVDTDLWFEEKHQCSIADFFALHSEKDFRREEQIILYETERLNNSVIATGGGMPCFEDNMQWMLQQGRVVYIEMSVAALYNRLIKSKKKRPLLTNAENIQTEIQALFSMRENIYRKAHIVVSGINFSLENLVNKIEK